MAGEQQDHEGPDGMAYDAPRKAAIALRVHQGTATDHCGPAPEEAESLFRLVADK